jgi:molybdate transport system substrate-binding protein
MKPLLIAMALLLTLQADTLRIAVAANVSYAIEALKAEFTRQHPGSTVEVILGSSGKLTAQIIHGAPYDLFLSADMKYPNRLYAEGVATSAPLIYAKGALIMLTTRDLPLEKGLELLADPRVERIAIANYKLAPYGKAAVEAMQRSGVLQSAKPKFINGESITQAVQYTLTAADVGFIAKSAIFSPKLSRYNREGISWIEIDPTLYPPIEQGMVLLEEGVRKPAARAFYDFMLTPKAQSILQMHGYRP